MERLPSFLSLEESGKGYCLRKSFYVLKQSPESWFGCPNQVILQFGLQRSNFNHYVFYQQSSSSCILLVVFVDDIVSTSSDGLTVLIFVCTNPFFRHNSTLKIWVLQYFLGIEVARCKKGIEKV